nr:hypothetical protein [Angustibacter aerolatus]
MTSLPTPGTLTFTAPRRAKPPRHLADLAPDERADAVREPRRARVPRAPPVDALLRAAGPRPGRHDRPARRRPRRAW